MHPNRIYHPQREFLASYPERGFMANPFPPEYLLESIQLCDSPCFDPVVQTEFINQFHHFHIIGETMMVEPIELLTPNIECGGHREN